MRLLHLILLLLCPYLGLSQSVLGKVINQNNEPLQGASVYWSGTTIGTTTGTKGEFELSKKGINELALVSTYVGHEPDTIWISDDTFVEFSLEVSNALEEVTVRAERPGVIISNQVAIKTEQITQTELGKAACCDLAGCFETQSTVQPQTTNSVLKAR